MNPVDNHTSSVLTLLHGLKGSNIAATYVSPELTLSFQARIDTVLESSTNEVALLLSQGGRIIASGAELRVSGNGLVLDISPGKKLYLNNLTK